MEPFLSGKTALVTGATRGIGRAVAEALLTAGASVVICGLKQDTVDAAVEQMQALGSVCGQAANVANAADVQKLVEFAHARNGRLDILVNNAGIGIFKSVEQMQPAEWHRVLDLNLTGVFYCCHAALPLLKERGDGYIFNISSLAGKNPFKGGSAYNASKFGVEGFTEAMLLDHRHEGIRATSIMPGSVDTAFGGVEPGRAADSWKIAPSDIAEVIVNLLRLPRRSLVSRVEIRPSAPPQK